MDAIKCFLVLSKKRKVDIEAWPELIKIMHEKKMTGVEFVKNIRKADVVVTGGGDGTLLGAIRKYWRYNIPFLGIHRGTKGFLLNPLDSVKDFIEMFDGFKDNSFVESKLIKATFITDKNKTYTHFAFNDAYLNAVSGTSISGQLATGQNIKWSFRGDGIIVATPQGSTAYSRNAGGTILPLGHAIFAITTSNSSSRAIRASINAQKVVIDVISGHAVGHADNKKVARVKKLIVEPVEINVKLVFKKGYDFEEKRYNTD